MKQSEGTRTPSGASRRDVLRRAALAGGAMSAAAGTLAPLRALAAANPENLPPNVPEWSRYLGSGVDYAPYGEPSPFEEHVVRRNVEWLTASTESSVNFCPLHELDGWITPNGLHFERHHGGTAEINPEDHRFLIHGMVDKPMMFTMADLMRLPSESRFHFIECAANGGMEWRGAQLNSCQFTFGMVSCVLYTGVPVKTLMDYVGVRPGAKWALAEGADSAGMTRTIPIEKLGDDCLLAWAMNGEKLRPEQGYPLRLVVPGFEGNMWVKWLRRLEFGDAPWFTREETSKYTDLMEDGNARGFTWFQEAKSVVTFPCPEKPVDGAGVYRLTGLAWSGRGRVKEVHVTTDGGRDWHQARLMGPVLDKCLTRFEWTWHYDGKGALVQSRAVDETGYVQPTMGQLQAVRGVNSIYHNNAIQTWRVNSSGEVENVRLAS